jgi:hypothetical protein
MNSQGGNCLFAFANNADFQPHTEDLQLNFGITKKNPKSKEESARSSGNVSWVKFRLSDIMIISKCENISETHNGFIVKPRA